VLAHEFAQAPQFCGSVARSGQPPLHGFAQVQTPFEQISFAAHGIAHAAPELELPVELALEVAPLPHVPT
jgi:hypothetical protein